MKILIVSSYFGGVIGGALNFIRDLAAELSRRGHSVEIALDRRYKTKFNVYGATILWFDSLAITAYSPSISLLKILLKTDADIIHIQGYRSFQSDFASLVATLRGIPSILTPHGSLLGYKHLSRSKFDRIPYVLHDIFTLKMPPKLSSFVIATSTSEFQDLINFGIDRKKIKKIPLAFELHYAAQNGQRQNDTKKILFVGRIVPNKNLDVMVRAFALVLKKVQNVELLLVGEEIPGKFIGDSGYKEKLVEIVNELGINDKVKFLGWQNGDNLWSLYTQSYLMMCLSTYENFCLPILEAASFGIPIVSTNVGIAKDVVGNNEGGRIVHPDPISVADAIFNLLRDEEIHTNACKFALSRAKDFSVKAVTDKYEEIFRLAAN